MRRNSSLRALARAFGYSLIGHAMGPPSIYLVMAIFPKPIVALLPKEWSTPPITIKSFWNSLIIVSPLASPVLSVFLVAIAIVLIDHFTGRNGGSPYQPRDNQINIE